MQLGIIVTFLKRMEGWELLLSKGVRGGGVGGGLSHETKRKLNIHHFVDVHGYSYSF